MQNVGTKIPHSGDFHRRKGGFSRCDGITVEYLPCFSKTEIISGFQIIMRVPDIVLEFLNLRS